VSALDEWNTAAAWVSAVGTVGAFAGGLALFWREFKRDNYTEQDRRDAAEAVRRAQAELVAAWTGPRVGLRLRGGTGANKAAGMCSWEPPADEPWNKHFHEVVVHNGSAQPLFDVVVMYETANLDLVDVAGGEEPYVMQSVGLAPPTSTQHHDTTYGSGGCHRLMSSKVEPIAVAFTDVHGVRWERDTDGVLTELPD